MGARFPPIVSTRMTANIPAQAAMKAMRTHRRTGQRNRHVATSSITKPITMVGRAYASIITPLDFCENTTHISAVMKETKPTIRSMAGARLAVSHQMMSSSADATGTMASPTKLCTLVEPNSLKPNATTRYASPIKTAGHIRRLFAVGRGPICGLPLFERISP